MATPPDHKQAGTSLDPRDKRPSSPQDEDPKAALEEKYTRLEDLLRQTLALAGEISETKALLKPVEPYTAGGTHTPLPEECIVLRKTAEQPARGGGRVDVRRHSRARYPRRTLSGSSGSSNSSNSSNSSCKSEGNVRTIGPPAAAQGRTDDSELDDNASASASSSLLQEPFSPRSLALSLDAVVEGNCEKGHELVCLDAGSSAPNSPPLTRAVLVASPPPGPPPPPPTPASAPIIRTSWRPPVLPSSHRIGEEDAQDEDYGRHPRTPAPAPLSDWRVRIVPVAADGSPGQETSSSGSSSPALVKLEAVFPYRVFATDGTDSEAADSTSGRRSEGSYVIIGRRRPVVNAASGINRVGRGDDLVGGDVVTDSDQCPP